MDIGTLPVGNYRVKMKPYNSTGGGPVSNYIDFLIKQASEVPTSVKAASASYNSIKLTWGTVLGASGYEINRAASSTGTYSKISAVTSASYTNISLITGQLDFI